MSQRSKFCFKTTIVDKNHIFVQNRNFGQKNPTSHPKITILVKITISTKNRDSGQIFTNNLFCIADEKSKK